MRKRKRAARVFSCLSGLLCEMAVSKASTAVDANSVGSTFRRKLFRSCDHSSLVAACAIRPLVTEPVTPAVDPPSKIAGVAERSRSERIRKHHQHLLRSAVINTGRVGFIASSRCMVWVIVSNSIGLNFPRRVCGQPRPRHGGTPRAAASA